MRFVHPLIWGRSPIRRRLIYIAAMLGFALAACTGCLPMPAGASLRMSAQAPEAGLLALAGDDLRTVRLLFARNGSMVLVKEISLPPGEVVKELSLSADGRDLVIGTQSQRYLASARAWKLNVVDPFARAAHPRQELAEAAPIEAKQRRKRISGRRVDLAGRRSTMR